MKIICEGCQSAFSIYEIMTSSKIFTKGSISFLKIKKTFQNFKIMKLTNAKKKILSNEQVVNQRIVEPQNPCYIKIKCSSLELLFSFFHFLIQNLRLKVKEEPDLIYLLIKFGPRSRTWLSCLRKIF